MTITPVKDLVANAEKEISTWDIDKAKAALHDDNVHFIDIRDIRELWRSGTIPGALHAPRGMLEFWADPESPYYNDAFSEDKTILLFCALSWRSALAAKSLQDMGFANVAHIEGGFEAWTKAGGDVIEKEKK